MKETRIRKSEILNKMFDVIRDVKYISVEIIINSIVNIEARDCSKHP